MSEMKVRLPKALRDWVERRAKGNFRSINSELLAILTTLHSQEQATRNAKAKEAGKS